MIKVLFTLENIDKKKW